MKKSNCWLIFDIYNLAYRAFFTTGGLSHQGGSTGVLYGVFREIVKCQEKFGTHLCVFCFDLGKGIREQHFNWYKETRRKNKNNEPEIIQGISAMKGQIESLRRNYLEKLGYPNVLYQVGMEADDIIASVCHCMDADDDAVIVSGDEDLYQLLSNRVIIYQPREDRVWTKEKFKKEYGIKPSDWIDVKCIAGCSTDDIPGIKGVGEKTAIKWLQGKTKPETTQLIAKWTRSEQYRINEQLVALPYEGTNCFDLIEHEPPTKKAWHELMQTLGMSSMAHLDPSAISRNLFTGK